MSFGIVCGVKDAALDLGGDERGRSSGEGVEHCTFMRSSTRLRETDIVVVGVSWGEMGFHQVLKHNQMKEVDMGLGTRSTVLLKRVSAA